MQANILYLYPVTTNLADSVYKTSWCLFWKPNAPHAYTLWVNFWVLLLWKLMLNTGSFHVT